MGPRVCAGRRGTRSRVYASALRPWDAGVHGATVLGGTRCVDCAWLDVLAGSIENILVDSRWDSRRAHPRQNPAKPINLTGRTDEFRNETAV